MQAASWLLIQRAGAAQAKWRAEDARASVIRLGRKKICLGGRAKAPEHLRARCAISWIAAAPLIGVISAPPKRHSWAEVREIQASRWRGRCSSNACSKAFGESG